jgi:hypothetical protein
LTWNNLGLQSYLHLLCSWYYRCDYYAQIFFWNGVLLTFCQASLEPCYF